MSWTPSSPWSKPKPKAVAYTNPYAKPKPAPVPTKVPTNLYNPVASQNKPGTNPRVDWLDQNMPEWRNAQGYQQTRMANTLWDADNQGGYPTLPSMTPLSSGGGGYGGGGGGGGGGGPTGLDQATLDWILAQLAKGKPQDLTSTPLDLPDPKDYFGAYDTSGFDTARKGVTAGIQGIRDRGTTAINNARDLLSSYKNPYATGLLTTTPSLQNQVGGMMSANGVDPASVGQTQSEGALGDDSMRRAMQMYAATDERRQQDNLMANRGDLNVMNQNVDLENLMLMLGIDMGQQKGQSAWDQMLKQAGYDAATTEASQNWQRGNAVGDTNVGNKNTWNSGLMQTLLSIIGSKGEGTTLPDNIGAFI